MAQEFVALKTPPTNVGAGREPAHTAAPPSSRALVLRLAILLMMAIFIFGNIATWAPMYELQLINTFTGWWNGYPHGDTGGGHAGHSGSVMDTGVERDISHTGHTEMVRPTFLFLFCILPFFVGIILIEVLRVAGPARRLTSVWLWKIALVLRRKPRFPVLGVSRFTIGEWIFGVVFVIGGNLLCFYYEWDRRIDMARDQEKSTGKQVLTTAKYWNIVGISCAYLAIYNMAFLLLPVTRNSVWMEFFNVSYANGVKLHRWMGFATAITSVIHMVGYWGKWIIQGTWRLYQLPCINCDITDEFTGYYAWFNTFGFISVLAMVLMIPTSLPVVRRKMYEWFYITHWVLFVISFFFAILHWGQILWWILPGGLLFLISRAVSTWNGTAPVTVRSFTAVANAGDEGELIELVFQRADHARGLYDYKVGNFVYLNVPEVAKLEWHALTIASSPRTSATDVKLLIKPVGEWSQKLLQYAKDCHASQTKPVVYIDGFYGSSLELYDEYATVCLVAGGIGVTPLLAILEDVAAKLSGSNGWNLPRVEFVLSFRELSLLKAVAPVLLKLKELDPSGEFFKSHLFGTRQPTDAALDEPYSSTDAAEAKAATEKVASHNAKKSRPFYEPLRTSQGLRFGLFVAIFSVAIAVLAAARWGNGAVQGDNHPQLWPLQRAFEFVVLTATIVVAHAFIWYEYAVIRRVGSDAQPLVEATDASLFASTIVADVHSMRDLVSHLGVTFGQRPALQSLLEDVRSAHESSRANATHSAIGIFVSGPEAMKQATSEAIATIGAALFDIHEEEFEL